MNLKDALAEISGHSAGGSPFLIAFGLSFVGTATLSYQMAEETTALIAVFQGGIALPLSLWLEKKIGWQQMSANNPLRRLSMLLAFSQMMFVPALVVLFNVNPRVIPVVLTGLAGIHFAPYAWLHQTNIYLLLAIVLSAGGFLLQLWLGSGAFHINLLFIGIAYLIAAPLVYLQAVKMTQQSVATA